MTYLPNLPAAPASRRSWLKKLGGLVAGGLVLGKSRPAAALVGQQVASPLGGGDECFVGEIMLVSFRFPPKGWAFCNGQLLPINQNQALFALLGTTYGGDGQNTFGLPDLRSRVPMGFGQGTGLTNHPLGEKDGAETVALTTSQIPAHTHSIPASAATGTTSEAGTTTPTKVRNYLADNGGGSAQYSAFANVAMADALLPTGSGQGHPNIQPVLGMNFVIALQGIFPSHN